MKKLSNSGFGHLGLLAVVLTLAIICLAGYQVWHAEQKKTPMVPPAFTAADEQ